MALLTSCAKYLRICFSPIPFNVHAVAPALALVIFEGGGLDKENGHKTPAFLPEPYVTVRPEYVVRTVKPRNSTPKTEKTACYSVRMRKKAASKPVESDNAAKAAAPDGYLVKAQLARMIQKDERTVERYMRLGIVPYIKLGKGRRATVLFSWPDVKEHLVKCFGVTPRSALAR
jgi:hypothetical protein